MSKIHNATQIGAIVASAGNADLNYYAEDGGVLGSELRPLGDDDLLEVATAAARAHGLDVADIDTSFGGEYVVWCGVTWHVDGAAINPAITFGDGEYRARLVPAGDA